MERVKRHHYIETVDQVLSDAVNRGIFHLHTEDAAFSGRTIKLRGKDVINFGSCSYLGLELDPRLAEGVIDATRRFGCQYSSSRAYISSGQYLELESLLEQIFHNKVVVSASTTLAHIGAIPVLVGDDDAVILDHQVHASVQTAVNLVKSRGVTVSMIRHNNLDELLDEYKKLKSRCRHIWYMVDGVYSMYGDFAPLKALASLLDENPQLRLYVDDAHGMSWTGHQGSGYALSQIRQHPSMVLAVSLNKAFACAGGALILPDDETARKIRTCASSLIFSGPVQPPMLGAAIACAKIHASGQIHALQNELYQSIQFSNAEIKRRGLPLVAENSSPILFVGVGLPRVTYNLVNRMMEQGFYLNAGIFPGTPMKKGGIRFTLNRHLSREDISQMVKALAHHYPQALEQEGSSLEEVSRLFKLTPSVLPKSHTRVIQVQPLEVTDKDTIQAIDQKLWDNYLGNNGSFNWQGMAFQERLFGDSQTPEHHYRYHYFIVKDHKAEVILATFFSLVLMKDDMFASASVSAQIEQRRQLDQYYFTSNTVMLGSMLSEGEHLYLDENHPRWQEALALLLTKMQQVQKAHQASSIVLRDFVAGQNPKLKNHLLEQGFIEVQIPDNHRVSDLTWRDMNDYLSRLSRRARRHVRREMVDYIEKFELRYCKRVDASIRQSCYQLYCNVKQGNLAINCFGLPFKVIDAMFDEDNWDIIRLHLVDPVNEKVFQNAKLTKGISDSKTTAPVAVMFAHKSQQTYTPLLAGLNYDYLLSHKIYKQLLYQVVQRARQLNLAQINFGFTASQEKRQVGAVAIPSVVYVQANDNFTGEYLDTVTTS